jgi:hypothetical protein
VALVFLGVLTILLLAIVIIMAWGAVANLIHVSRIAWRFLARAMQE